MIIYSHLLENMGIKSTCLLWTFFLNLIVITIVSTDSNRTDIPDIIYDICPYADICNRTASHKLSGKHLASCCSSCSCDEDCGLRLDCCFEHLDTYKLKESGKVACIDSAAVRFENYEDDTNVLKYGYLMVQTCNFHKVDTDSRKCNFTDSQGHPTFAPVSYYEKNLIFINTEGAMCNSVNVTKINTWDLLYRSDVVYFDSIDTNFQGSFSNKTGELFYIPPTNEDWLNKRCYNDIVSVKKCSLNKEWEYMCNNFNALFHNSFSKVFDNIFCQLCLGVQISDIQTTCATLSMKWPGGPKLTFLLNKDVLGPFQMLDLRKA